MKSLSRGSGAKHSSFVVLFFLTPPGFISPTASVLLARGRALCLGEADKDTIQLMQTAFTSPGQGGPLRALPCRSYISDFEHHFLLLFSPFWAGCVGASMLDGKTDVAAKDSRRGLAAESIGFGMESLNL